MVCKHFSSIPKLSLLWVDGFDKNICCHLVLSMHVISCMSFHVVPCHTHVSHHVKSCHAMLHHVSHHVSHHVKSCRTMSHHVSCHVIYVIFVDLILLMCKLSWLLQELPVLYKPVFLEHLLTSEERQLQKQPILPLKWNDTHSQVIFCAVRCLVKIRFKCLKGLMGIFSYNETFFL